METIKLSFGTYKYCRKYGFLFKSTAIWVYTDDEEYLGTALIDEPTEGDAKSLEVFKSALEDWIVDNMLGFN